MSSLPHPDNRLYLGAGGSGKTTLAMEHARRFNRVLLVLPDDSEGAPAGFVATRDRARLCELMLARNFRVAFVADHQVEQWEWANQAAWTAGDTLIIWEECGVFMGGGPLKVRTPLAYDLWMRGRHRRNRVFACSQRPASVSADCRANLYRAVIFNSTEPNDLKWFRAMLDGAAIDAIKGLDYAAHEALDWQRGEAWKVKRSPFA